MISVYLLLDFSNEVPAYQNHRGYVSSAPCYYSTFSYDETVASYAKATVSYA